MQIFIVLAALLLTACTASLSSDNLDSTQRLKADARITLGMNYMQRSHMVKAKQNFQMALEHAPKYYRSHIAMARYFDTVSDYEKAHKWYKNALRSEPNNGQVLNDYGSFLCKRSQFKLAQMQFTKAMALDDYYHIADVYQNSALCWLKEGQPEQAITHFRHTLARDPNRPQTLLNLAKLEIEHGALNQALKHLDHFTTTFGQHPLSITLFNALEEKKSQKNQQTN
ncbi:type IV pilus biogenesis/stability protein PilW [Vibrio sp. OCN044]|uniref:Type IV pilus biogenesis/stability protein PilW n=1 Tax=Vibrio tetraodonis subsp. pristinus TaxID=2695891 RepID=A0A6L8LSB0_9VIBR|nr:type IV pilus biogenesis/stability protein PilW [Vibrio tetraodonis]MYM58423.1 type IV pilus biogenesis/stability protein PilW [Vibrio tetraodonis subsp. pristinus]